MVHYIMITCNHMCRASRSGRLAEYGRKPRRVLSWPKKTYRRPRATPARAENRWGAVSFRVGVETSFQNVKILGLCRMTQVFFAQGHPPKKGQAHPQPNLSPPICKVIWFCSSFCLDAAAVPQGATTACKQQRHQQ